MQRNQHTMRIYIYKVVIFVYPIITQEPNLPQLLIGKLGRPTGMFLSWFLDSKLSGSTLIAKIQFHGKIIQVWVTAGVIFSNLGSVEFPSQKQIKPLRFFEIMITIIVHIYIYLYLCISMTLLFRVILEVRNSAQFCPIPRNGIPIGNPSIYL